MKTQEQAVAEDALILQRIQSNAGSERGMSSTNLPATSIDLNDILSNDATVNASRQASVFPATPDNFSQPVPQEAPGKVWPTGLYPYVKARVKVLFDASLSFKNRLRSMPVLGYGIGWLNAFLHLPLTRYRHTVAIDVLRQQNALLREQLYALNQRVSQLEPCFNAVNNRLDIILTRLERQEAVRASVRLHQFDNLDVGNRLMRIEQLEIARKIKQFTQLIKSNQADQLSDELVFAQILRRLETIEKSVHGATGSGVGVEADQQTVHCDDVVDLEKFYLDFEAQFRGSTAEIKQRQQVYLSYFDKILAQPIEQRKMFVDIGCGRGEWLELLSEQGVPAIGIDSNAKMVDACLQNGYAAKVADGIEFLKRQEKSSLSGVSGFHIIEHLPFEKLIALFDAAYAALSEDGILIFETPNPENLIIGACNFYYDPTHLKPIVPDVAQFIAKQRGFRHVEIKRLHPFPDDYQMSGDTQLAQTLNKFLFSAQDYAVIARK